MKIKITVNESNQPSIKALKAFNQYVFESVQKVHQNNQQNQGEVKLYEQKTG